MSLFGRDVIYTKQDDVTAENVLDVLLETKEAYLKNRGEIEYLYKYFKGDQPVLRRKKAVRPEICSKIVENRALEIVEFQTGYLCGEPIQYIARNGKSAVANSIARMNDYMVSDSKGAKDKSLVEWAMICGVGYRIVTATEPGDDKPFELHTLDPRDAYVIRSRKIGNKVLAGVHCGVNKDNETVWSVYTNRSFFEVVNDRIVKEEPHALGLVPIVEYKLNNAMLGVFEPVIPILDAINTVSSNRVDGIEQFIQYLVKFINCDIDKETFAALQDLGAISIKSIDGSNADVEIMTQELNQQQTQTLVDHMYKTVLTICGMPSMGSGETSDSSNNGAALIKGGWTLAEARAKDQELMFKQSERDMLRVALKFADGDEGVSLKLSDIDIKFTRRNYENIQTKAQVLCEMLNNDKIDPRLAFSHCGMFTDSEEAYTLSMKWYETQMNEMAKSLKETVNHGGNEPV